MSLRVHFDKPIGSISFRTRGGGSITYSAYESNALYCWVHRDGDTAALQGFFADDEHMKKCLGLVKGYYNLYSDVVAIRVNKNWSGWKKLAIAFMQANDGIVVSAYRE